MQMLFCKTARFLGILGVLFGALRVGMGILGIYSEQPIEFAKMYLGNVTTGEAIDEGLYRILVSIVIGAIGEIGLQLAKPRQ